MSTAAATDPFQAQAPCMPTAASPECAPRATTWTTLEAVDQPLPTPDLGGIHLPAYHRGRHYTIDQWERIAHAGMPFGDGGSRLLADAHRRLRATQLELAAERGQDLAPEATLERRYSGILNRILTLEGGNHLSTWMLHVFEQEPRERTIENATFAVTRSWLPFRAAWDVYMDAISDPAVFRNPQVACDRCVDLPRGHEFVDAILREEHNVRLNRLPGYTAASLREERCIATWLDRLEQYERREDARVEAFFTRRRAWVGRVIEHLYTLHDAGRMRNAATAIRSIRFTFMGSNPASMDVTRDRSGSWSLLVPGAGLFAGHGSAGLLRAIAGDGRPYASRMPADLESSEIVPWLRAQAQDQAPSGDGSDAP